MGRFFEFISWKSESIDRPLVNSPRFVSATAWTEAKGLVNHGRSISWAEQEVEVRDRTWGDMLAEYGATRQMSAEKRLVPNGIADRKVNRWG